METCVKTCVEMCVRLVVAASDGGKVGPGSAKTFLPSCIPEAQESRKVIQRFNIDLFENIKRKVTLYALKLTLQQYYRLKEPAVLKDSNQLPPYTERYHTTFRLLYAHDIKCRLETNKRLSLKEDFHSHW